MDKDFVTALIINVIQHSDSIPSKLKNECASNPDPSDVILRLSSLEFIDLILVVETALGANFSEKMLIANSVSIKELAERISRLV